MDASKIRDELKEKYTRFKGLYNADSILFLIDHDERMERQRGQAFEILARVTEILDRH
jgi:hypothetical protein